MSPAILAHAAFAPPSMVTMDLSSNADVLQKVSKRFGFRSEREFEDMAASARPSAGFGAAGIGEFDRLISSQGRRRSVLPGSSCIKTTVKCDLKSRYRTIDGRCNNLQHPEFGSTNSPYNRLANPAYDDEIGSPRTIGRDGSPLPSARSVSIKIHETRESEENRHSHMVMQWGQFLDHDITLTPQSRLFRNGGGGGGWSGRGRRPAVQLDQPLDCSECSTRTEEEVNVLDVFSSPLIDSRRFRPFPLPFPDPIPSTNGLCFPIPIPENDPTFKSGTCMHFVRSAPGQLSLGARQQLNQITSYMDASNVYGSDSGVAESLRERNGGRLKTSTDGMLPHKHEPACKASAIKNKQQCFKAGDVRCNVHPSLMAMHTLWMNHHNRIAGQLARINPHWDDDEKLYQEARKIVIAQHQHITYNEWLPHVLGEDFMDRYSLKAQKSGRYYNYDSKCDATIYNEFAAAALRFGHSMINDVFERKKMADMNLTGRFMDPSMVHGKRPMRKVQALLEGLMEQKAQKVDRFMSKVMRDDLFGTGGLKDGMDIVAINIQRGRDHGLQPYHAYRKVYGLSEPKTWADFEAIMNRGTVNAFKRVYKSPLDIDLFSGLLAEPHVNGGLVGELCAHILAAQFHRLRDCDRFYYENGREQGSFSKRQLKSIRQTSLAKVVCDNVEIKSEIDPQAFLVDGGSPMNCKPNAAMKSVDLSAWKEEPRSRSVKRSRSRTKEVSRRVRPRCFADQIIPEIGPWG